MANEQQRREIQIQMEEAQALVARATGLDKLQKNSEFKKLIHKAYLEEEPMRLTYLLADHNLSAEQKTEVVKQLEAIAYFRSYLASIYQTAQMAQNAINACQEADAEMDLEEKAQEHE